MTPSRPLRLLPLALATMVAASACSDDTNTVGPGSLSVSVEPATLTLAAGSSEDVKVTIVRSGDFDKSVTLSVSGLPDGVDVETSPIVVGQTEENLTFIAAADAPEGSATVTITANGDGVDAATATLPLTVTAAEPTGSFALTTASDSVFLVTDVPDTLELVITRDGDFSGPVTFVAAGMTGGLTAVFEADTVAGDTARVTMTADTSVVTDSVYVVTVTGSGEGVVDVVDSLWVRVDAPASGASGQDLVSLPVKILPARGADTPLPSRTYARAERGVAFASTPHKGLARK